MIDAPNLKLPIAVVFDARPKEQVSGTRWFYRAPMQWAFALLILCAAVLLRVYPSAGFTDPGFDEVLYRDNLLRLEKVGVFNYPAICQLYLEDQRNPAMITKLPPTRFLYVWTAWVWKRAQFGDAPSIPLKSPDFSRSDPALRSLQNVACLFSCLLLVLVGACSQRMFGPRAFLPVLALMAFAPLQIHFAQHALIDGFFTFWATLSLWLLWENLRRPNHALLLAGYAISLALLVLTKENAFFVWVGLAGLLAANRWTKFGEVTPRLLLASIAGPLAGLLFLVALAGGISSFVEIYTLLVSKAQTLRYAVMTGDGPWYRYFVDLMTLSPIVLILAIGGLFTQLKTNRAYSYLVIFMALTYVVMCNVRYGMNLRYASIWDLPLRALAAAQIGALTSRLPRNQMLIGATIVAGLCAYEWRQYTIFFSEFGLYEPVSEGLLRAVKILK